MDSKFNNMIYILLLWQNLIYVHVLLFIFQKLQAVTKFYIYVLLFIFQKIQTVTKFYTCIIFYFPVATGCKKIIYMYHILYFRCYRLWQNLNMYHILFSRCYRLWQNFTHDGILSYFHTCIISHIPDATGCDKLS